MRATAVIGEPVPPGDAAPPEIWSHPAQPLCWSHQSVMVRPSLAAAKTSRRVELRATAVIGVRSRAVERDQRPDAVPDHLAADRAERDAEVAHLAVVLRPERAAVEVVGALERAGRARRDRARPVVDLRARGVAHGRNGGRRRNRPAPLERCAVGVRGHVRLGWLATAVAVVTGLVASRVVRVLVGEPVRRVPDLVDRDLGRAARERVGADRTAASAVDGRVHDDEHHRELRNPRGCGLQGRGVVAHQQPADPVLSERRVEVRSRRRAGAPSRDTGSSAPESVDRTFTRKTLIALVELVVRRRRAERGEERVARRIEGGLLRGLEPVAQQHDVERTIARRRAEDLRGADDGAVGGAHRVSSNVAISRTSGSPAPVAAARGAGLEP